MRYIVRTYLKSKASYETYFEALPASTPAIGCPPNPRSEGGEVAVGYFPIVCSLAQRLAYFRGNFIDSNISGVSEVCL